MFYQLTHLFAIAPSQCGHDFFGLIPWFHYLPANDFGYQDGLGYIDSKTISACDINSNFHLLAGGSQSTGLPLILLAVVDDLLRIAGIVAVGFILYGAVQFITSQGSADQAAKARTTIINALIGLAISIIAITIVSFIGNQLS